ncbi:MAG TPA: xylulokinase [Woeseiaceae bacterium]|nr:xylulokinase [Woeseiaceae bacterium]
MTRTVLGIDLGTQSLKVLFYDYEARRVAGSASAPLALERRADGSAEQRAEWWTAALRYALGQVPEDVRRTAQAIGVSGQQHGFVALDGEGAVLAPVKLWCDTSTQAQADAIEQACGGRERCIEYAGNPVLVGYTASKVRWLKEAHPELYARLARILLPHDYLNYLLTGRTCMEYGDASGTGFFDVRRRQWSEKLLAAVDDERDLTECLPPLEEAHALIGETTPAAPEEWGLPAGVPVATGGGDNMMAAIGTGNVTAGRLTMSLGSSGTLFAHADRPIVDPQGEIAAFCSSTGGWLPLVCTMNCTLGTELVSALVGRSARNLDDDIAGVETGAGGLITLPFFNGERTPNLPRARGCVLGLSSHNASPAHLLRSAVEGATFALRYGLDRLRELGVSGHGIVLTGGGANSAVWRQIVADVCRLPVTVLEQAEGASFGAALQALWALEVREDSSASIAEIAAVHLTRNDALCAEPDAATADRYAELYAAYRQAVTQVTPLFTH